MNKKRKSQRPKLLSHSRPALAQKPPTLPSKATRSLIRNHHTLQKRLSSALANNDTALVNSLQAQLSANGGLAKYQQASIQGQSLERGGDSSKVLVEWLTGLLPGSRETEHERGSRFRLLEVGALRTDNACSRSGLFDVTRIDLRSQHPDIETQDFMEREIPSREELNRQGFDIVSLSLVVNYVGDAAGRGEMLKRVSSFLRSSATAIVPSLFLVLPVPCVSNSRYLDEERLQAIMLSLGYRMLHRKTSGKLFYSLWRYDANLKEEGKIFRKEEVRKGGSRNNFAIIVT